MNNASDYELNTDGSGAFYQIRSWAEHGVFHGFSTRSLDVRNSTEKWESLYPDYALRTARQVHGVTIAHLSDRTSDFDPEQEADALVSSMSTADGSVLGIKTADCTPVLLWDEKRRVFAAIHAGWRSTVSGIITNVMSLLEESLGIKAIELHVGIGPAAQSCCYQVGEDVLGAVGKVSKLSRAELVSIDVVRESEGKCCVSIPKLVRHLFEARGVRGSRIIEVDLCTICNKNFFSFRREKELSGRQVSFISSSTRP